MKDDSCFAQLEKKIIELQKLCNQLSQENRILVKNEQSWKKERSLLIGKNELVRGKIDSVIRRLKALE